MRYMHTFFTHFSNEISTFLVYMGMCTRVPTCARIWAPICVTRLTKYWHFVIFGSFANSKLSILPRTYKHFQYPRCMYHRNSWFLQGFISKFEPARKRYQNCPLAARPQLTIYARSNFTFKSPARIKIHTYLTHLNGPLGAIRVMFSLLWRTSSRCHISPSWTLSCTPFTFALKPPRGSKLHTVRPLFAL